MRRLGYPRPAGGYRRMPKTDSARTTSLLDGLLAFIPPSERVVVIEDNRELQLQGAHVVHLEAQRPSVAATLRSAFARCSTSRCARDRIAASNATRPTDTLRGSQHDHW